MIDHHSLKMILCFTGTVSMVIWDKLDAKCILPEEPDEADLVQWVEACR